MNLNEIEDIIFGTKKISITESDTQKVNDSFEFLAAFCKHKIIYGINTGFGPLAQYRIEDCDLNQLQYNIIRSHSCGAGEPLSETVVRAAMLSRLYTFLNGKSGVHVDVVTILTKFLNNGITPFIPQHGSVGASGDLVQLAHMALNLIGEGDVFYQGRKEKAAHVMKQCGIEPLKMVLREGLALTNGTAVMTGLGLVNLIRAKRLVEWSLLSSVMMNEIASSYDDFMSPVLNALKNHEGQIFVADTMRKIAADGSRLKKRENILYKEESKKEHIFEHKVQPYYSLRCVPQILGPIVETLRYSEKIVMEEFFAADDNPIIDSESQNVLHGGNFHGDYISFEMDKLKIGVTKMTMLAERQMNYLFHDKINGILPPFVNLGTLGLNYGLQAAQFTATSTTAECQTLSNPMYVHSIPNNNDNQDIVSMGTNAGLLTSRVIDNSYQVMAIHLMALVQAVDCLGIDLELSSVTKSVYDKVRVLVPKFIEDTPKYEEIATLIKFMENEKLNLL